MFYILSSAVLWSLFPVLTTISFFDISPLWSAAIGMFFSMLYFLFVLVFRGQWTTNVSRATRYDIMKACLLIGVGYYAMIYVGISLTTPGNAAVIGLMEIFFSFLFISVIGKHEALRLTHAAGAIFMICGSLFILIPSATGSVHIGDVIIFFGCMLPPLGNLAMQRARKEVSASYIMFWRALSGTVCFTLMALVWDGVPSLDAVLHSLPFLLMTGIGLLGFSKILWIEAIHRLPITQTISIGAVQPLLTMIFAFAILGDIPGLGQLLSLPLLALGMILLTRKKEVSVSGLEAI